jgi:hypothetical protein
MFSFSGNGISGGGGGSGHCITNTFFVVTHYDRDGFLNILFTRGPDSTYACPGGIVHKGQRAWIAASKKIQKKCNIPVPDVRKDGKTFDSWDYVDGDVTTRIFSVATDKPEEFVGKNTAWFKYHELSSTNVDQKCSECLSKFLFQHNVKLLLIDDE